MVEVGSDIARLRRVIIHRPGAALEHMLPHHIDPSSPSYLLFDDLVHVPQAQREHDQLAAVLSTTAEVAYLDRMLAEVLALPAAREMLIAGLGRAEDLSGPDLRRLGELEPTELVLAATAGRLPGPGGTQLMPPLPNLIFTRDLAAVMGDLLVVGNASKRARRRESLLTWAVVDHHPWFADTAISRSSCDVRRGGRSFPKTVEGGDVLVISESLAVIGASERTSWSMITSLTHELIHGHGFTRVLVVEMAKQRSSMHLDTVFTLVDWDTAVVYRPLLESGGPEEVHVTRLCKAGDTVAVEAVEGDFMDALAAEGHPMRAIFCGGGHPIHERREQWTDGANYVAISPGVAIGYARNEKTAAAMSEAGFRVTSAEAFLREFRRDFGEDYDRLVESRRRYAIQITGPELCRGRGGPRCLTFPVQRG